MAIIACDSHKRYTQVCVQDKKGRILKEGRIEHRKGEIKRFLGRYRAGTHVAVETIGNWYWIIDEIEEAGMKPKLVHARKAKLMLGSINKTDKLDARGLNRLQRTGTLPDVWIPPMDIRDKRDISRTRVFLARERTKLKNRIHSVLAKYALHDFGGVSDIFGKRARVMVKKRFEQLPEHTRFTTECLFEELESVESQIMKIEKRMKEVFTETEDVKLLMSMPGIGFILGTVIAHEIGDINRFPGPDRLASYSGTVPRVSSSGGHTRYGPLRSDVNRYLKWAFIEAGNAICKGQRQYPGRHVVKLYKRIKVRKGRSKAIGAVARHLAEASYWVLKKRKEYIDPAFKAVSSRKV